MRTNAEPAPNRSSTPGKEIYEHLTMFSIEFPGFFKDTKSAQAVLALVVLSADGNLLEERASMLASIYKKSQTDAIRTVLGNSRLSGLVDKERFFEILAAKGGRNIPPPTFDGRKLLDDRHCDIFIRAFDTASELLSEKPEALKTVVAAVERRFGEVFSASPDRDIAKKLLESRERLTAAMALAGEILDSGVNDEERIPVL